AITMSDFGLFREAKSEYTAEGAERIGVDRSNWSVTAAGVQTADLSHAIDGNAGTFWLHQASALPQQITIDMQQPKLISGFSYLPRQDKNNTGTISRYRLESSVDGISWHTVSEGEFSNIAANPISQYVDFGKPVSLRYLRFTA